MWKADDQRNGSQDQQPHRGSKPELVGEEADEEREQFGDGSRHRADGHEAGGLTGEDGV